MSLAHFTHWPLSELERLTLEELVAWDQAVGRLIKKAEQRGK